MADSDSDQQLHYVRGHTRPNRRRLSSNTVVTTLADIHSGGVEGSSGDQGASGSEETLSAHESGMEEVEWEKKGMSGDLASRGRSAGPEKRTHDTHLVTKQKDSQQRKKGFGKEGRPPKRRRGQPSVGRGYKWSDSSDSDVEGGGGGREREADMRGTRRSRRSNKGNRLPRKDYNEGDSSPTPPKRRKLLRDTTPMKKPPAPKNLLGELLMDIPEIDICPLPTQLKSVTKGTSIPLQLQKSTSTPSTTSKPTIIPTTSKARTSFTIEHKSAIPPKHATSRASGWVKTGNPKALEMGTLKHSETTHKASAKKHSCSPQDNQSSKELSFPSGKIVVKQQRRFGSSHCGTSTLLISNPPEIMLQSKQETAQRKIDEVIANKTGTAEKSTKLSTHYKFLMSWENDFFKGSMSTKAPVLYALDTIADKLATRKGPWLEKAKVIWNHWKKISPALHEFYVNKAKENRVKLQEKAAEKKLRKLQASLSSSQRPPGVAVHSRQTSHIVSVPTITTHPLVVSKAIKLTATVPSTTAKSKLPSQISPHVMGVSVNPNMSVQKPAPMIKDIKSEDLCSAVDKEIETLEETLGTSPPAISFSPRSVSLSPLSPTTTRLKSPKKLKRPPSKSSPPTSMCTTTTSGQESHQRSAGTEASKWKLSSSGIYLPSATELSTFCASPALISPLCPISPTCTQPPSTSSTVCEGAVAVTPTSPILSLPLTPLLPPRISSVLKCLSSSNIQVPTLSPQPVSDGRNSMALSSQQLSMKPITRSTSVSPKQKRSAKSNSETKSGAVSLTGSAQKAKKSTSSSSLTSNDPFLQNLLANVCLQNQPYFKHSQTPPNVSTDVASSATPSKEPALSSSGSTTDSHKQTLRVSLQSQPNSQPVLHLTSRSSSLSTSSIGSTVANPMTQLTTINTVQTIPHSTITALLSTSTSTTVPQTTTIIPGVCQTHPASSGLDVTPKTQSSSSGVSAAAVSTFSLPLLSSTIAPASTAAPINRQSITAGTSTPSIAPIPTSASTLTMTERQSNTDGTCAVVVPLPMFSLPIPLPTSTTGSTAKTTTPQSIAGNTTSTTSAIIPSSTITSSSASATPNLGLQARKLDSHTAEAATLPLINTTEAKPVSVHNPISTVSPSALELSVHNPSMQDTRAGKATPYIPSFHQHASATVPTAIKSGLQLDREAQTIHAGNATMPTLSFLASSSNTTSMSDECVPKPEAQNLHGGDTASSSLQSSSAIASSAAMSHLQPNVAKPETRNMHSDNTASSAIALAPATSASTAKPGAQDAHIQNTAMPLPNTLEPTATNALGPAVKKKKHARTTISKAERLSKHGTKISLPHKPPSFMLPIFPSESQSAHIPPSLLAASSSRAQPKSSHTSKLKGGSCPPKTAETATSFHTQNPFSSLSGPSFQSKFLPSNFPSVAVAHQQQQQKQQWKCYSLMSSRGSLTFPSLGPEITPSSPPDLPHTFSRDSQMEQHTQQQNLANPFQSTSASGNQNRPLTLHIASTSANVQDLPSDSQLHQQPSSSSTSPSLSSPSPTTTLPSSKAAKERNPGSSKSPLYIASPSLLREFPEIEAVSKLHSRALGANAMGAQYGTAHTGPFPAPKYEFKPFLCSELSNLPSFTSLGLPSASPRLKTEALDIDNKGTIQFYSDTPTSVTDNGESTPNHSAVAFSGPQIGTTSTSQPVIDSSLFTPHSNPGSASIANTFFPGLENLTMTRAPSQRSKDSRISTTPTLSSFSTAAAGPSKDSPSIVTASVSADSKTASADSNDWRLKLLQKLQDRLKQQDKGQMELKSEPRADKQLTGKLTSTKGKKPTQTKKWQRHSSTSSSISGLFTPPLTPLSSSLSGNFSPPPSRPRPMMVTPEQPCKDFLLQENRPQGSLQTPSSETGEVNPTLEINPPIGDFSRWELERLYVYNLAVLEHQWKYTKMLEKKLLKMEQESVSKKPSKLEVYQRFLEFVVEPAHFPDAPAVNFPELSSEEIELQGTFDKPILDKNHDFYASFSGGMQ